MDEKRISGIQYFDTLADNYIQKIDSPYHRHRLNSINALISDIKLKDKKAIDFGSGEGVYTQYLAECGARVIAMDPSEKMTEAARKRLAGFPAEIRCGDVSELELIDSASIDLMICLNTLAYMTEEEEDAFYRSTFRILKNKGQLLVSHSNELFDMFTLNKFTAHFFSEHFGVDISSLIVNNTIPDKGIYSVRENPLSYKHKLSAYGFEELEQSYCMFHRIPPLLMADADPYSDKREFPDTLTWGKKEEWKLMFQCSTFASLSQKA